MFAGNVVIRLITVMMLNVIYASGSFAKIVVLANNSVANKKFETKDNYTTSKSPYLYR